MQGFASNYLGKPHYHKNLNYVNGLIDYLELLVSRIDVALENNPEILAQLRHPIQVENKISGPMFYSSNFSGHKITLKIPVGVSFQGEKAKLEASVTNLSDKSFYFPGFEDEDGDDEVVQPSAGNQNYKLTLEMDGNKLIESSSFPLGFGATKSFNVLTPKLNPNSTNKIKVHLEKSNNGKFDFFDFFNRRLGSLSYDMNVVVDNIAPEIKNLKPLPGTYHKVIPAIEASIEDAKGRLDLSTVKVEFKGQTVAGDVVDKNLTSSLSIFQQSNGDKILVNGNSGDFVDGRYELIVSAKDFAGNTVSRSVQNIVYDKTIPVINLYTADNILTNKTLFKILATVTDHNVGQSRILQNGNVVFESSSSIVEYDASLREGLNTFEIESVDLAGNVAVKKGLYNIFLDTIPPEIAILPASGSTIFSLDFKLKATSNESLSLADINGEQTSLNSVVSFEKTLHSGVEGNYGVIAKFYDKAGNEKRLDLNYKILLKVLNGDLIAIVPNNKGKLEVRGAAYAAKPGVTVEVSAGFFNSKNVIANEDGSFVAEMDFFSSITLYAKDQATGRSDTIYLKYNVDTTLSGTVKDVAGNPLRGVTVTILESAQSTVTDGTGGFKIASPATGDKTLSFDGTTVPLEVSGPNKKFSKTNIAVSIGTTQLNVIDTPIYLAPLMFDGTETKIENGSSAVVTSPHAEGVVLEIPANAVTFPNGTKTGSINVIEVSGELASIPTPEYAKPDRIYAFEPSGTIFSTPVQLTLPNSYNLPAKSQVVILSKNSIKGIYEIDGLARVDENGETVTTEPGSGITHFSEIYMAPLGPTFKKIGGADQPGADTFNGAVSTTIELPSFKRLGSDITPGLIYKSQWANPNIVVTNLFDVPRQEFSFDIFLGSGRSLLAKADARLVGSGYYQPSYIEAQFTSNDIISEKMRYTGIPNKSVIAYAMDLSSQESGIQPYQSKYEMKLNQILIGSKETRTKKLFGSTRVSREPYAETRELEKVYPSDISGGLVVQNYKDSSFGRGWRPNMGSKIYSKGGARVLLENADGSTNIYGQDNLIETVYTGTGTFFSASLDKGTDLLVFDEGQKLKEIDLESGTSSLKATVPYYSGYYGFSAQERGADCYYYQRHFNRNRKIEQIIQTESGHIYMSDAYGQIIDYYSGSGALSLIAGGTQGIPANTFREGSFCGTDGVSCGGRELRSGWDCWYSPGSSGSIQVNSYAEGNLSASRLNTPKGIIPGNDVSTLLVADYGNNRIRKIDLRANAISTFAGNGQTNDVRYSGSALNASIFHPQGLVKDEGGNIYVSSENGYIRKIDPSGRIEMYAGRSIQEGGVFADTAHADKMNFSAPYGMVIDQNRDIMYVADVGHHRVVAIDMVTRIATTVAGTGQCINGNIGDGKSALLASLCNPKHLGLDDSGNLLIFDSGHNKIRRISFGSVNGQELAFKPEMNDNSQLKKLADGSFRLEHRSGKIELFNKKGNLLHSEDRIGRVVSYEYDDEDRLQKVTDETTNSAINYNYSGNKISSIVDPTGRETTFDYDGNNLVEVSFPDGSSKRFEYNGLGLMTAEYDQRGSKIQYLYNQWNRLWKVIRPDNSAIVVQDKGSLTVGNNFSGGVSGNLKSLDGEAVDRIKDAKGNETTFNTDESGYVSKITDVKGDIYKIERDLAGRPIKITRPDESVVTMAYDTIYHDLIRKADTLSNIELEYTYDQWGNPTRQTLENGESIQYNYSTGTGLLLSKILPLNTVESYEYYANGLLSAKVNPLGQRTSYVYGTNGNLVTLTDNMGQVTQIVRDLSGNILSSTNAKGQTVNYSFDEFNRLNSVKSALNEVTSYEYLASGQLAKIIDPENNQTIFEYDLLGRLMKKTDPLGYSTQLAYDLNDNIVSEIDPVGNVKIFEYDHLDRLIKKILPDNVYEMTYDERSNVKSVKNSRSEVSFDYLHLDSRDVVVKETTKGLGDLSDLPQAVITYDFDESGNRIAMGTSEGEFTYAYDKLNRLKKIVNHKGEFFDFNYDQGSRLTTQRSPASQTEYSYDNVNFLTEIAHKKRSNQNVIAQLNYERDTIGNITKQTTLRGDHNFSYDGNNQLINATHPEVVTSLLAYDALGNRVTDQNGSYTYGNKKQRLESDWKFNYLYDNNGNLISKIQRLDTTKITNYEYSSENQLLTIKEYNASTLLRESYYGYDALGRRVLKEYANHVDSSKSFTKKFIYDGQSILFEVNGDNNLLATYTHSLNRIDDVLGMERNGISYFYIKDHLGTINEILNNSGSVVQRYVYSAFGEILKTEDGNGQVITSPAVENFYTFTGRESDFEFGLNYYRARYYDSSIGRFISSDPDMGRAKKPITFNSKYIYGNNSPVLNVDPQGRLAFLAVIAIAAVVGGTMSAIQSPKGWDWGAFASGAAIGAAGGAIGFGLGGLMGPMLGSSLFGAMGTGAISSMGTYGIMSAILGTKISLTGLLVSGFIGGVAGGIGYSNGQSGASQGMKDLTEGTKTMNDEIILNLDLGTPIRNTPTTSPAPKFNLDDFLH